MRMRKLALVLSIAAVLGGIGLAAALVSGLHLWKHDYAGTLIDPPLSVKDLPYDSCRHGPS
jgi:hypothetical protein